MKKRIINLLQISDFHLFSDPDAELLGMNTDESFRSILKLVSEAAKKPDLIIASGDLVHDGSGEGYDRMADQLNTLSLPVYCLPGNHDEKQRMAAHLPNGQVGAPGYVDIDDWRLVFLDSTRAGEKYGHISKSELGRLRDLLLSNQKHHVLIFLHHQPMPIDSRWLDTMSIDNADEFFDIVDCYKQIRGIAWGHVHQDFTAQRNGRDLFAVPSTCIQFTPGSDDFSIDEIPPGVRWFQLHPDGRIDTEVQRLVEPPSRTRASADSTGY